MYDPPDQPFLKRNSFLKSSEIIFFPRRQLLLILNAHNDLTSSQPTNDNPFDEITNHPIIQSNQTIGKRRCLVLLHENEDRFSINQLPSLKLTASLPLTVNVWKMNFFLGFGPFSGAFWSALRECESYTDQSFLLSHKNAIVMLLLPDPSVYFVATDFAFLCISPIKTCGVRVWLPLNFEGFHFTVFRPIPSHSETAFWRWCSVQQRVVSNRLPIQKIHGVEMKVQKAQSVFWTPIN